MIEPFASIYAAMARQVIELREAFDRLRGVPVVETREVFAIERVIYSLIPGTVPRVGTRVQWIRLDRRYWATTRKGAEHIISHEWAHDLHELLKRYDPPGERPDSCDKFTIALFNRFVLCGVNAVAIVIDYSTAHSYLLVFMSDQEPQVYDFQQRAWGRIGDPLYKLERGVVLL